MDAKLISERAHPIYAKRVKQLTLNFLAQAGGKEYVEHALQRFPNESNLSWDGDGRNIGGRISRVACVNDAGRISEKINQYLFSRPATRVGIDENWAKDVTGTGVGINSFWATVSESLTAGQWVWLKADRDAVTEARSLAERPDTDKVRWTCHPSTSVPDWSVDINGNLVWLITAETEYANQDPTVDAKVVMVRYLWIVDNGVPTWYKIMEVDKEIRIVDQGTVSGSKLPFVLIGHPSVQPWWYDTVESIQSLILNLESANTENTIKAVFPQLIISKSSYENLEIKLVERVGSNNGQAIVELAREMVRGLDTPLIEGPDDKNVTRYLMPSMADMSYIPEEIKRKRSELFSSVGLSLFNKESRMVESAEAKAFDQLDINSTLANRSMVLQEAEIKLVDTSKAIDSAFKVYIPVWPTDFSVIDNLSDAQAIKALIEVAVTEEQKAKISSLVDHTIEKFDTRS